MKERDHSPAPFRLNSTPGQAHILLDRFGDSIGALAYRTGDHPPEEQLANALLFRASPQLLELAEFIVASPHMVPAQVLEMAQAGVVLAGGDLPSPDTQAIPALAGPTGAKA
ncbi:hypothetical protein [Phenylobacterium sp.]|uniref:hypothetical protein n=1 Tax=Phenylobacterium sp. TaxID=1871053 RepID=UPI002F427DDB